MNVLLHNTLYTLGMGCSEQVERNLKICNNCQKVHFVKLLCVCVNVTLHNIFKNETFSTVLSNTNSKDALALAITELYRTY